MWRQLQITEWPKGLCKPIAVIAAEPSELATRLGVTFGQDFDDLDYFDAALVEIDSVTNVAFVRHKRAPKPGTEIWIQDDTKNTSLALKSMMETFSIERVALSWIHPDVLL